MILPNAGYMNFPTIETYYYASSSSNDSDHDLLPAHMADLSAADDDETANDKMSSSPGKVICISKTLS